MQPDHGEMSGQYQSYCQTDKKSDMTPKKAYLSPPVGGHLCSFRRDWQAEKCSNDVLSIITNGYVLSFITKPKLARVPLVHSGYTPIKRSSSGLLYQVSSVKECYRKGGKCKIS